MEGEGWKSRDLPGDTMSAQIQGEQAWFWEREKAMQKSRGQVSQQEGKAAWLGDGLGKEPWPLYAQV